jgi:hypothetical protein
MERCFRIPRAVRWLALFALTVGLSPGLGAPAHAEVDPLASWTDGATKKAIVEFVRATTDHSRDAPLRARRDRPTRRRPGR